MEVKQPPIIQNLVTQLNNQTSINGVTLPTGQFFGMAIGRINADLAGVASSTNMIDSGMSFPIKSGETWLAFVNYEMGPSLSLTGTRFQVVGPASSVFNYTSRATPDTALSGGNFKSVSSLNSPIDYGILNLVGVGSSGFCQSFVITASANGTVKMQYSPSGITLTALVLRAGTYFQAYRIV